MHDSYNAPPPISFFKNMNDKKQNLQKDIFKYLKKPHKLYNHQIQNLLYRLDKDKTL